MIERLIQKRSYSAVNSVIQSVINRTTVVDKLTKMARFIATKTTIIAPELPYQFVDELFCFYGLPMDIMSDREFISDFWTQVFKKLETTWSMSSTYHPQSDGHTERVNQIIEDMLRGIRWCKANKMGKLSPNLGVFL